MITTLGLIAVFLLLFILFQIARSNDLLSDLDNKKTGDVERVATDKANSFNANMMLIFLFGFMFLTFWSAFYYAPRFLPEAATIHGQELRAMFQRTLWATVPVFVLCHILLFYFAWESRTRKGRFGRHFAHSTKLELIWTALPAIVMVVLVFDGIKTWNEITGPASDDALVIEATAKQFQWDFRYAGADNKLGNKDIRLITDDNVMGQDWNDKSNHDDFLQLEMHVPVNREVLVKINSLDVLHSFAIPHFRVKMDAVPGIPTQFKFVPTLTTKEARELYDNPDFDYELACMELCGRTHFNMKRTVVVDSEEDYAKWVKEQKPYFETITDAGLIDFEKFPLAKQGIEKDQLVNNN